MSPALFQAFRQLAYDQAGIALRESKRELVSARIAKRLRALELTDPEQYLARLRDDATGEELIHFLDAISTNFTSFFREPDHFETLRDEVERLEQRGQTRFRIWCAASSTGEEPYTLAMTLAEALDADAIDWRLLATDISVRALELASTGTYAESRLDDVPQALCRRYFTRVPGATSGEPQLRVVPSLREHIVFKRLNLALPPFALKGPLDAVFCRNVMIYFDAPVRQRLVAEFERLVRPGGLVIVGHSETLNGLDTGLEVVRPSVYRKPEAA